MWFCRSDWDDDDDPSAFEAQLAMLDEVEAELAGEAGPERLGEWTHGRPRKPDWASGRGGGEGRGGAG